MNRLDSGRRVRQSFPELGEEVHEEGTIEILAQLVQHEPNTCKSKHGI